MIDKPPAIAANPALSGKWDEICEGREFRRSDAPTIALLCQWHAVIDRCMEDLQQDGEVAVAYMNDLGDLKALPQIATMKQASAEIRALNKQLGINDEAPPAKKEATVLSVIAKNRGARAANSA